ncbi:MAG TPA: EAL domain-containing protein [Anaerolineales bacterium]
MSNEKILVVDDNRKMADFLAGTLLPGLGYAALVAYDGKTGLEIIRKNAISILLLDIQLPDTTGLELLRQLRREGRKIPTIITAAHGPEQIAVDAFRLGVQDYLAQPFDADRLSEAIQHALNGSRLEHDRARLNAQLREQISWLKVLYNLGQSVASTLDLDDVLRRIVEAGVQLTRAEEGFLALYDEPSNQLYLRAVKNIDQEKSKMLHLPVSDSLVGSVFKSGRSLRLSPGDDQPALKVSTGFLVHSLIHVPLTTKGKTLGVLSVDNFTAKRAFSGIDEALLTSLADYAAVAIENACMYQRSQQEIQSRKRAEEALRASNDQLARTLAALEESEERYALAVRGANDGLWDWDLKSNRIYYSPRWKAMLGYPEDEIGNSLDEWMDRVHPEDLERVRLDISTHLKGVTSHFESEHRIKHKDGDYRWVINRGLAVRDGSGIATRMAGSQMDTTDRKFAEQKLAHDAFYDTLTHLPNRALFMDRLKFAIERVKRRGDYLYAVLFLDLDRFKDVNDSLGHMVGDQLLIAVANMLHGGLRATDTVARLSGDEFVILMEDIHDISAATRVADWLQKKLASPFQLTEHQVFVTTSVGIVLGVMGYQRPEEVLRDADIAMYVAKANGKARYEIFKPAMRERILERLSLENSLRQAIENRELRAFYQPIVSLSSGQLVGFEALVRWQHSTRGLLLPAEFLTLAEETGLIIPIDRWVLHEACRQLKEWQEEFPGGLSLTVNVNLSSRQIAQPDLVEHVRATLKATRLEAACLKLEITESVLMEYYEYATEILNQLHAIGVNVHIDHFGMGYSSLGSLHQFPVYALKIDRSFLNRMGASNNNREIVQTMVMLAHDLGMLAVAGGVETEAQLAQLRALSCDLGQGFLVSAPLDSDAAHALLQKIQAGERPLAV